MSRGSSAALSRDIQALFEDGTAVGLTDRQLLDRFAADRDPAAELAFEALVRRHGPMVLRVCRNALPDPNDAADAFQATFLVLVRRCGALRGFESLGGWLFGVASRVAARARVESARRRAIEGRAALRVVEAAEPDDPDLDREEFAPILQEEVRRLPEKYRSVVLLCYWEGLTHEQAAARLGCPLGTVRSRIARARELLRRRLGRRGVASMAGLTASGFDVASFVPVPAAVPDPWVAATIQAISHLAAGGAPASAVAGGSASVAALVHYTLRRMLIMKLKMTATCVLFIAMGAAGVILAAPQTGPNRKPLQGPRDEPKRTSRSAESGKKVQPALHVMGDYVVEPPDLILVEVLEALPGRPISGERLVRPDGKISLGFYGDIYVAGLTITEVKEKVVQHLRKYLKDDILGLVEFDEKGLPERDEKGRVRLKDLAATDRVFVDVTAYNSKNYYVQGEVESPGILVVTGHETILDAINYAGGLTPRADHNKVMLYRRGKDGALQSLPIDIDQITMGDDPTTNYQLQPGDRLVIPARSGAAPSEEPRKAPPAAEPSRPARAAAEPADGRPAAVHRDQSRDVPAPRHDDPRRDPNGADPSTLRLLNRRLTEVERKLDRVLELLEKKAE